MRVVARLMVAVAVLLSLPAEAQYRAFIGGQNKVRYDTFEWEIYETPHFRISYYDRVEPQLEKVASFAESSYDELSRRLNFQILEPVPMIVYATHAEFEQTNVIVGFIPEGVGAFASPVRNRMVLPSDLPDAELQHLIQHELTHIFQYEILFQGRRGRAIYARPPLWFMEGMASFYGDDESSQDEMYMRDMVLSDRVPSIEYPPTGFLAYRFGNKVFEYIEEEWGEDTVRDFVFAFRNAFGGGINRPFRQVLNMDAEEFDAEFRGWLRRRYEPFSDRGTPREYGRPFQVEGGEYTQLTSPAISPSGDLVAAFTTHENDVDVALFGIPDRRLFKNLTKGYTTDYEYLVAQGLTVAPDQGRDLAFSPDGNHVAVFARTARTRSLLLLDALRKGIDRRFEIPLPIDQATQPAFRPDGLAVAFQAVLNGRHDIFELDLATGEVVNLTGDDAYDASPAYSPDGAALVFSSAVAEHHKLIRLDLEDRSRREQLTFGPGNDQGAAFSADGRRLYFASDRLDGIFDIYGLDLETRALKRLTYVIGGAINPVPGDTVDGERVGFQAYSRGSWGLYAADPNRAEDVGLSEPPAEAPEYEPFLPAVTIAIDPDKSQELGRRKLFLEDAAVNIGVDQDGQFLSYTYLVFSDQYGDRRLSLFFNSVDTFSNFVVSYLNLEPRLQWGASVYDARTFYSSYDVIRDELNREEQAYQYTAATLDGRYPLSRYLRAEGSVGYMYRSAALPTVDPFTGNLQFAEYKEQSPLVSAALAGDTVLWRRYGPHQGSRWEFRGLYMHDVENGGGALNQQLTFDGRKYLALTQRSEIATRLFLGYADGNNPNIFSFGGQNTVRGFPTYSISGNRAGFASLEWRFPLIDRLDLSFMSLGGVRGRLFFDVGTAWYDINGREYNWFGEPGFQFMGEKELPDGTVRGESGRLTDGVASYGFGFSITAFGLPMHWDFIKIWDFQDTLSDFQTEFWIGYQF